ncbi:MAG: ABC transporter ATP-binding protein [Candidatus Jacksonbacteria bacterium]|nr:ABC transporter ATP-binding protein [Candidatus Jacksonbacteria bacterium]
MPFISVSSLTKTYRADSIETPALRGVSFVIERGEFAAIMGPSGSGKSTLLHILGFLERHTEGEYLFDGHTIDDYSENGLAKIRNEKMGFVFQAFNLLAKTSVIENVLLPLSYSKVPESEWRSRAEKAIAAVGLSYRAHHEPSQLSGGEKQRAAIARALITNPDVIFADEPTGNLDSKSGEAVMKILTELNGTGKTVILITHERDIAAYSRRIITMKDGKIEKDVCK